MRRTSNCFRQFLLAAMAAVILAMTCVSGCGKGENGQEDASISTPLTEELSSEEGSQEEPRADGPKEGAAQGEDQGSQQEMEKSNGQQTEGGETQTTADGAETEFGFEKHTRTGDIQEKAAYAVKTHQNTHGKKKSVVFW